MTDTLKSLRVSNGYTQADVAKLLDTTVATVSIWERGLSTPSPRFVPKLAKIFHVSGKEIFLLTNINKLSKREEK
jgi:transcriptional regulator with XRE-family HTH domain